MPEGLKGFLEEATLLLGKEAGMLRSREIRKGIPDRGHHSLSKGRK